VIFNESISGVGASYSASYNDQLGIGDLLCLKPDDSDRYALGVVRRIHKSRDGQVNVGIETISMTPIPVELVHADGRIVEAIYSPEIPSLTSPRYLILHSSVATAGATYVLRAQGKAYAICLHAPFDHTAEYQRTGFDVVGRG
jgi:hypothetical protein